jgi:hypothetical protein
MCRYLVGYLVWGYFIIYIFGFLIGFAMVIMRFFLGLDIFISIILTLIPFITALVIKAIINFLASNFAFLYRKSKILALANFKAFNVFLYFSFYFDCFMGIFSAISRLVIAVIVAIFMMPSKSNILLKNMYCI